MADQDDVTPVFQIQRMYLKDLSLEQPNSPQILLEQQQPQVDINLGMGAEGVADGIVEVTVTATVTTRDLAGNVASAADDVGYRLATDPPKATIKLDANFTGDGVVNLAESQRPAIAVTGTVGGDVKVGDPVIVQA